jgi:DNA-binding transcriptional ArsR family regulator
VSRHHQLPEREEQMDRSGHDHPADPAGVARARRHVPDITSSTAMADLLGVLADPTRARVLFALRATDELCVGDLALALDVSHDAVSYALRSLRRAGLVVSRREGRMAMSSLPDGDRATLVQRALDELMHAATEHP